MFQLPIYCLSAPDPPFTACSAVCKYFSSASWHSVKLVSRRHWRRKRFLYLVPVYSSWKAPAVWAASVVPRGQQHVTHPCEWLPSVPSKVTSAVFSSWRTWGSAVPGANSIWYHPWMARPRHLLGWLCNDFLRMAPFFRSLSGATLGKLYSRFWGVPPLHSFL